MGSTKIKKIEEIVEEVKTPVVEDVVESTEATTEPETKTSAKKAPKKAAETKKRSVTHGKKYLEASAKVDRTIKYKLDEAIELAKSVSYAKFGGAVEVHINTRNKNVRGLVTLPHLSGKVLTILAFGDKAGESGADMVGDDKKLDEIIRGKIDFDVLVTTPVWMPKLARAAKMLGPKGLMPNPKNGTVSDNLEKAVSELKTGKVEYRTENNLTTMHMIIGKVDQPSEELNANLKTLFQAIGKTKIKKMSLAPTMGPAVRVDLSSF